MEVEVVRSAKRRKSVSAPRRRRAHRRAHAAVDDARPRRREYVEAMVAKLVRQHTAKTVDLTARAAELARRYRAARAARRSGS